MQEELNQFERNKVWELVPRPNSEHIIYTKLVFKINLDENGMIIRNKARLVAQGLIKKNVLVFMKHVLLLQY